MAERLGILADDLTGAADTGVRFRVRGLPTAVLVEAGARLPDRVQVVVISSDSRHLPAPRAAEAVERALEGLAAASAPLRYKKIDSTLRGPLAAEVAAVLSRTPAEVALLAPAYPALGRTVRHGRLYVNDGVGVEVAEALGREVAAEIEFCGEAVVRQGAEAIAAVARRAREQRRRYLVADAATDDDLDALAAAADACAPWLLPVGSAGLAGALAARLAPGGEAAAPALPWRGPVLVLAGSRNPVTRSQVARLVEGGGWVRVELDPGAGASMLADLAERLGEALEGGADVAVLVAPSADPESRELARRLGDLAMRTLTRARPAGVVVAGGDTLAALCAALGASVFLLDAEPLPGLPLSHLADGPYRGLAVLSKAGGFGAPDALLRALARLRPPVQSAPVQSAPGVSR